MYINKIRYFNFNDMMTFIALLRSAGHCKELEVTVI